MINLELHRIIDPTTHQNQLDKCIFGYLSPPETQFVLQKLFCSSKLGNIDAIYMLSLIRTTQGFVSQEDLNMIIEWVIRAISILELFTDNNLLHLLPIPDDRIQLSPYHCLPILSYKRHHHSGEFIKSRVFLSTAYLLRVEFLNRLLAKLYEISRDPLSSVAVLETLQTINRPLNPDIYKLWDRQLVAQRLQLGLICKSPTHMFQTERIHHVVSSLSLGEITQAYTDFQALCEQFKEAESLQDASSFLWLIGVLSAMLYPTDPYHLTLASDIQRLLPRPVPQEVTQISYEIEPAMIEHVILHLLIQKAHWQQGNLIKFPNYPQLPPYNNPLLEGILCELLIDIAQFLPFSPENIGKIFVPGFPFYSLLYTGKATSLAAQIVRKTHTTTHPFNQISELIPAILCKNHPRALSYLNMAITTIIQKASPNKIVKGKSESVSTITTTIINEIPKTIPEIQRAFQLVSTLKTYVSQMQNDQRWGPAKKDYTAVIDCLYSQLSSKLETLKNTLTHETKAATQPESGESPPPQ